MAVASVSSMPSNKITSHNNIFNDTHKEQYLFLLEFFVHFITGERLSKLNETFFVPTSVYLRFLNHNDNDAVEITSADSMFSPLSRKMSGNNTENFYSGRSVLFAIPQRIIVNKNTELKINIEVYKKIPESIRPDIMVGSGELDITQEFIALREDMLNSRHKDLPSPQSFEGPIQLYYQHKPAAIAMIFSRISALGQSIITEFKIPCNELSSSSFVFKSDENDYNKTVAYKCKIVNQSQMKAVNEPLAINNYPIKSSISQRNRFPSGQIISNSNIITKNNNNHNNNGNKYEIVKSVSDNNNNIVQSSRGNFINNMPYENPVVLKVSGLLMDDNDNNMNKPTLIVNDNSERDHDDDHDIFVLRIGKKGIVGEGEKSDIQVEMRTPKGPIKRPPIRYETREIQTDIETISVKSLKTREAKKMKKKNKNKNKKRKKK